MSFLFSPSTRGFYVAEVHGDRVPADVVEISGADHAALMVAQAAGKVIQAGPAGAPVAVDPPAPSLDAIAADCAAALSSHLDAFARSWGYDSAATAASYAMSTIPRFKAEARAVIAWRDKAWLWAEGVLDAVKAGARAPHASPEDFLAEAPDAPARPAI